MRSKKVIKSKKILKNRRKNKNITKCKNKYNLKGGEGEGKLAPNLIEEKRGFYKDKTRNMSNDEIFEEVNKKNIPLRFLTSSQQQDYTTKIDDMLEKGKMLIPDVVELIKKGIIPLGLLNYTLRDAYYRSLNSSPSVRANITNHAEKELVYIPHAQQQQHNNITGGPLYSLLPSDEYIDVEPTIEEFIRKIFEESPSNQPPLIPLGIKLSMDYIVDFIKQKWEENSYSPLSKTAIKYALLNFNLVKREGRIVIANSPRKSKNGSFYELNNNNNKFHTYEPFQNIVDPAKTLYEKFSNVTPSSHIYDLATPSKQNVLKAIQQLGLESKLRPGILEQLKAREREKRKINVN